MEIEITDKKNNPFFKRTEVYFTIKHENQGTPNQAIIRNELAGSLNVKKDQIIIDNIHSGYGVQETSGYAKVYSSRKEADKIERKHILVRNKFSEGKPKKKDESEAESEPSKKTEDTKSSEKPGDQEVESDETSQVPAEKKEEDST